MRLPAVVIITVAWPTKVIAIVPSGGRGVGAAFAGAVPFRSRSSALAR
jgi:hypothetical protein